MLLFKSLFCDVFEKKKLRKRNSLHFSKTNEVLVKVSLKFINYMIKWR